MARARRALGGGLNVWAGEITEQPTWMVMNAIRLAGVTATRRGYRIAPHYPFRRFSLRTTQVAVTSTARALRGYVTAHVDGPVRVSVALLAGIRGRAVRAFADGRPVPRRLHGREVVFELRGRAGARARWTVRFP
jgi:hypothetical protein